MTRGELKTKAKGSLKANYWKAVLVALLVMTIGEGTSAATRHRGLVPDRRRHYCLRSTPTTDTSTVYDYDYDYDDVLDGTYGDQSVVCPTMRRPWWTDRQHTVSNDLLLSDDTLLSDEAAASIRVAVIALRRSL